MNNTFRRGFFTYGDGTTTFFMAVVMMIVLSNVLSPIMVVLEAMELSSGATQVIEMCLNALIQIDMLAVILFMVKTRRRRPELFFNKTSVLSIAGGVLTAVISLVAFFGVATLFDYLLRIMGFSLGESDPVTVPGLVSTIVLTCAIAPVAEELVFRGALLSGLKRKFSSWGAVLLCGFCFAMMHMNPAQTVYQFCLGCFLALLAVKTGSIVPTIVAHSVSNIGAIILSYVPSVNNYVNSLFDGRSLGAITGISLLLAAGGALLLTGMMYLLGQYEKKKFPSKFEKAENVPPEFFNQTTMEPVFSNDPAYGQERQRLYLPHTAGYDPFTGAPVLKTDYSADMQMLCNMKYEKKWGETGGFFGKNTAKIALAVALGLCAVQWIAAFFIIVVAK